MTPFRLHIVFGLVLLIIGITFDFVFVQSKASQAFRTDPMAYLNSFKHQLFSLTKFYMIAMGLLNIALALLITHFAPSPKMDWTILVLIVIGSIFLIGTGFWYASAGPSFTWELRCTVLTIGLFAVILGLALEIYKVLSGVKI